MGSKAPQKPTAKDLANKLPESMLPPAPPPATVRYQCPCGCVVPMSELKCKSTPNWQNRWQCPKCGKYFSM